MIYSESLLYGKKILKEAEIESYAIDALLLLMFVTKKTKVEVLTNQDTLLKDDEISYYKKLIGERKLFKPIEYIIGKTEFYGLDIIVTKNTLIPRGDTEILVETVIENAKNMMDNINLLELCTGTGCISIALAKNMENTMITCTDISKEALKVCNKNIVNHSLEDRCTAIESNMFDNKDIKKNSYDIIISNPPYIERAEIEKLSKNVKDYEPIIALDGGETGLEFYEIIARESRNYFKFGKKSVLAFEIGYNQGELVRDLMVLNGFSDIKIIKDLSGKDRVIIGFINIDL